MNNLTNELNKRIEIWGKTKVTNEIGESDFVEVLIQTIWSAIIPQTGNMQKTEADTILSNVDVKFKVRYIAGKNIKTDNWIIFKGQRYDIKYILNPFEKNEWFELFAESVTE